MTDTCPRLRMFAGPNGSGKTTVKQSLQKSPAWFGAYVNADDLEASIHRQGFVDLEQFSLKLTTEHALSFFSQSTLIKKAGLGDTLVLLKIQGNRLYFSSKQFNSYHASVLSDYLRQQFLDQRRSFTFETVMSHESKVEVMRKARQLGYRTYLYYIGTEAVEINVQRVHNRVKDGGHAVKREKIVERYARSIRLLPDAIEQASRAFLFDNSSIDPLYFAEITEGTKIEFQSNTMPHWFSAVLMELKRRHGLA